MDDNPADVDLTREILRTCRQRVHLSAVEDGEQALAFLRHHGDYGPAPCPDLLVLDLNLPRKDGRAVLKELKSDRKLSMVPVVVFTTSQATSDVMRCYELGANCYLRKPGNLAAFRAVVQSMAEFWLETVSLPQGEKP